MIPLLPVKKRVAAGDESIDAQKDESGRQTKKHEAGMDATTNYRWETNP
jgi:hypothetical protein